MKGNKMTKMKKLLVVLLVFVLGASIMVGCGGKTLEGRYKIVSYVTEGQDLIKLLNDAGINTDGIYLEFTKDGKFTMGLEIKGYTSDSISGSYVLSGKTLVFTTKDGGLDKATIEGDKITLKFDGDVMVFQK